VTNIEDDDGSENVSEIARYYGHFERQQCISVYSGVTKCNETIYTLVFKYYEAEDLFDYISTNHPLRNTRMERQLWNDDVKRIFNKMVHLSTELAKKGITHGDISTENYLIDKKGNIILIDFGNGSLHPHLKGIKGFKPMNLPPEFIEDATKRRYVDDNKEFLGEKCDVFGLGVALYVLLAGLPIYQKPFDDHFKFWYFYSIRHQYYENVLSEAPEEAKDLLPNLLEKNPMKRFSLEQILQHKYCIE
jgi:serine/threonine protein kinase